MSLFCERQLCYPAVDVLGQWRDGGLQVFGTVTRQYLSVFRLFAGESSSQLERHQLLQAFNHMKLYPSKSQIYSMLRCARECSERDGQEAVTFGEFCVFAAELEDHYQKFSALDHTHEIPGSTDPRYHHHTTAQQSRPTPSATKYKVFLGGSCNPTTWRKDIAIPHLNQQNLSYYDPQVENWSQELIAAEDEAKEASEVLLFVIDSSTRSVASLVEAAYLSGRRRRLVLVMKGLPTEVDDEVLSENELRDLRHSHAFLCDVVERQWCPIFDSLEVALACASKVLHRGLHMSHLGLEDGAQPVRHPGCKPDDKLRKIKDVFREFDPGGTNGISLPNAFHALLALTGKEHGFPAYDQIVGSCMESGDKTSFDFNEFCCLATEYALCPPPVASRGAFARLVSSVQRWWNSFKTPSIPREVVEIRTAVFLGGTCQDTSWREDVAIPMLRRHGLSFFNPKVTDWNMANISIEANAKNTSLYLLFVISESARGIASMIEAAHCIGQRRKVVLCIQQMQDGVCVYGERLTGRAVRDYNRARCYLADLAAREGAPLFEDIREAVETLAGKLCAELGAAPRQESGSPRDLV